MPCRILEPGNLRLTLVLSLYTSNQARKSVLKYRLIAYFQSAMAVFGAMQKERYNYRGVHSTTDRLADIAPTLVLEIWKSIWISTQSAKAYVAH